MKALVHVTLKPDVLDLAIRYAIQNHQLVRKLQQTNEKLTELDRLKTNFLSTASHELRTPLNSIIGFTGVMLQGLAGPITAVQEKQMTMVYRNAKHLLSLINDVLDLSKLDADKVVIRCQPFDLPSLVEKTVASMTPQAQQKGLKLEVDLAEEIGTMTSDERRV